MIKGNYLGTRVEIFWLKKEMVMLLYVGDFLLGNFLSIVNYLKLIWIGNNRFVLKNWKCY